jgi:hypothetical protein
MATRDEIYDEAHDGLTWDASKGAYRVQPDSPWDDDIDGVWRDEQGIWADGDKVAESFQFNMREAGLGDA